MSRSVFVTTFVLSRRVLFHCHTCRYSRADKLLTSSFDKLGYLLKNMTTFPFRLELLCTEHARDVTSKSDIEDANCVVCERTGDIGEQLFCTSCGLHYHGGCLDPAVEVRVSVHLSRVLSFLLSYHVCPCAFERLLECVCK